MALKITELELPSKGQYIGILEVRIKKEEYTDKPKYDGIQVLKYIILPP